MSAILQIFCSRFKKNSSIFWKENIIIDLSILA